MPLSAPLGNIDPDLLSCFAVATLLATAILHILLATGVAQEATRLERRRGKLWFIGPLSWAFATLFTGLLGATAYWLMHHSTLNPPATRPDPELKPQ